LQTWEHYSNCGKQV